MKQGYGSADTDKVGKEKTDKPLNGPGAEPRISALVGGISNLSSPPAGKSGGGGKRGNGGGGGKSAPLPIAPYTPGGFRNAAMEHKR